MDDPTTVMVTCDDHYTLRIDKEIKNGQKSVNAIVNIVNRFKLKNNYIFIVYTYLLRVCNRFVITASGYLDIQDMMNLDWEPSR
jgi:hypothetical protein